MDQKKEDWIVKVYVGTIGLYEKGVTSREEAERLAMDTVNKFLADNTCSHQAVLQVLGAHPFETSRKTDRIIRTWIREKLLRLLLWMERR
jgi:phosphoenolpyruvate carboxylase